MVLVDNLLQIGVLTQLNQPACMPYQAERAVMVVHDQHTLALAGELMEGIALQLHSRHANGQAQLVLFEAAASPQFAQLKRLLALPDNNAGKQLFTSKDMLRYLGDLEERVHRRFALLAQAGQPNMAAYNRQTQRPELVDYVLISGLGMALAEPEPLRQLQLLVEQGPAVGIVPLLLMNNSEADMPHMNDFRRQAVARFWEAILAHAQGLDLLAASPLLHCPAQAWHLLQRFGVELGLSVECRQAWVERYLAQQAVEVQDEANQDFLQIKIGHAGANPAYFRLGEYSDAYHALIGGATRTGKTTLLNNLILTAATCYSPTEMQFTLLDFKDGVSFWEYEGLGHVAALYAPVQDDFPQALACLEQFEQQISQRYAMFRKERVANLADYNRVALEPLPRCLLVIDEAQSLFEGRHYQQKNPIKRLLSSIAKKGAAAGMHMILSTQSFQNVELEGDVKDQFHLRIGLRHASAMGCRALMGRDNDAMLALPRFHAIYNRHQGEAEYNQVIALDDIGDFRQRLDDLKAQYPKRIIPPVSAVIPQPLATTSPKANPYADGNVEAEWD